MILVFPDGIDRQWRDGRREMQRNQTDIDDVGFIAAIIDEMISNYGIDPTRVYVTGISNGGFMSVRLAVDLSDKIAAVAPVTAQLSKALENRIPQGPVSIMLVNGTDDPVVPFDGGHIRLFRFGHSQGEILSTAASIEHFRRHNKCHGQQALWDKVAFSASAQTVCREPLWVLRDHRKKGICTITNLVGNHIDRPASVSYNDLQIVFHNRFGYYRGFNSS
jgi:poly(3-hydroxybutyrate) depolymerase